MNRKKFIQLSFTAPMALLTDPIQWLIPTVTDLNVKYFRKGTTEYEQLRHGFNKRIDKYPAVIAQCFNELGVKEAVIMAIQQKWPVAVKSGGHCMEGFSCNTNGMVIDLSSMNSIQWLDDQTVKLGPACRLSQLYDALLPKGKIIPGGSCAGVAIGGLSMGGGYGLMARQFGLTCDSLQAVSMIDGKGKLVDSNTDKELLWACKGGNNGNFGAVTSLTFKVHEAPATMKTHKFRSYKVNAPRAKAILQQWFQLTAFLPDHCFSAFVMNRSTVYILLTQTGADSTSMAKFIAEMSRISDKHTQTGKVALSLALKNYYGRTYPMFFKNASAGLYKNYTDIEGIAEQVLQKVISSPGMIYQVNTLGGQIQNSLFKETSCFPYREYPYFSELQCYWDAEGQGKERQLHFQEIQQLFSHHQFFPQYRNYPDLNFSEPLLHYYGQQLKHLKRIKQTYDKENLFRFEQSID